MFDTVKYIAKLVTFIPLIQASARFAVGLCRYIQNSKEIDEIRKQLKK